MSDNGQNDGNTDDIVKREVEVIIAENDDLKTKVEKLEKALEKVTVELKQAKDFLDSNRKGELMAELQKVSNYGHEYMSALTVDELRDKIETLKNAKTKKFQTSADLGGDTSSPLDKLHSMYKYG